MEKIRELIIDKLTVSTRRFSKECGVNRTTLDEIMNNRYTHKLSLPTIKKICNYFDVDFRDYLNDK